MKEIKQQVEIITDSTADVPEQVARELGIHIVPLRVMFEGKTYKDKVDMELNDFYHGLRNSESFPSTSQPPPGDFVELFEAIQNRGHGAVAIHLSSLMSGTERACALAGSMVEGFDLAVVDAKTVTIPLGLLAIAAAKAAKEGKNQAEIEALVKSLVPKTGVYFMVESLDYLYKGGRIGGAAAFLGGLLNIKPILTVNNGIVDAEERVRGRGRGLERLIDLIEEKAPTGLHSVGVIHIDNEVDAQHLRTIIGQRYPEQEVYLTNVSAVLGSHVGPGAVGIGFIKA